MDVDAPMDQDLDFPSSPSSEMRDANRSDGDVVRWQSSQSSCAALAALLAQSSKSSQESLPKHRHLSVWDAPGSTLVGMPGPGPGPLSRADSRPSSSAPSRPRPRPLSSRSSRASSSGLPTLRRSLTAPNTDHSTLIALIQGVSARVDENAQRKTRYLNRRRVSDTTSARSKHSLGGEDKHSARKSPSNILIPKLESSGRDRRQPAVGYRSLPDLTTLPSGIDDASFIMEVDDGSFQSMMDTESPASSAQFNSPAHSANPSPSLIPNTSANHSVQSDMPPPPAPISKYHSQSKKSPHSAGTWTPSSTSSSSTLKMHPILLAPNRSSQPPQQQQQTQPSQHKMQPTRPFQHQSSRPPVLGMRRTSTYTSSSFSPSQVLPDKQKGFKPPLPRSPQARTPTSFAVPQRRVTTETTTTTKTMTTSKREQQSSVATTQPDSRSSSPAAEADSSFGDLSFDVDANALEETMKQYD